MLMVALAGQSTVYFGCNLVGPLNVIVNGMTGTPLTFSRVRTLLICTWTISPGLAEEVWSDGDTTPSTECLELEVEVEEWGFVFFVPYTTAPFLYNPLVPNVGSKHKAFLENNYRE